MRLVHIIAMTFIYHSVPHPLLGNILYPLNELHQHVPEAYTLQVKKYIGREELLKQIIPILNCLWNDVLQFSTVHPEQIRDELIQAGFNWLVRDWFVVEPSKVGITVNNTVIYYPSQQKRGDFTIPVSDVQHFSLDILQKLNHLPTATKVYYREAIAANECPLAFNFVPHVLYRGSICLDQIPTIAI